MNLTNLVVACLLCVTATLAQQILTRSAPTKLAETDTVLWSDVVTDASTGVSIAGWIDSGAAAGTIQIVLRASKYVSSLRETKLSPSTVRLASESVNLSLQFSEYNLLGMAYDNVAQRTLVVWSTRYTGDSSYVCYGQFATTTVSEDGVPSISLEGEKFSISQSGGRNCYSPSVTSDGNGVFMVAVSLQGTSSDLLRAIKVTVDEGVQLIGNQYTATVTDSEDPRVREVAIAYLKGLDRFTLVHNKAATETFGLLLDATGTQTVNALGPAEKFILEQKNCLRLRLACHDDGVCVVVYVLETQAKQSTVYYSSLTFSGGNEPPVVSQKVSTDRVDGLNPDVAYDTMFDEFVILLHHDGLLGDQIVTVPYVFRLRKDGKTRVLPTIEARLFPLAQREESVRFARIATVPGKTSLVSTDGEQDFQLVGIWTVTSKDMKEVMLRYIN